MGYGSTEVLGSPLQQTDFGLSSNVI